MFKYASAIFYTGISETVVVVGVQRLFVAMLVLAWLFGCVAPLKSGINSAEQAMCQKHGEHSHKKYDS